MDSAFDSSIDTVVFDIDGTLLDSNYHHAVAWSRAFDALVDRHVPASAIHRAIGMGGDRLVAHVAGDDVEERLGDAVRERWEQEYDPVMSQTRLFDRARELLAAVQERGLQVVLASSSIPKHAEHALELLDAKELADDWTTSEDAGESKPDPELLDRALEKVSGGRAVMIGDSVWDVEAANRQGIPTIGLLTGGSGHQELADAGAIAIYRDCADLLEHLDDALERAGAA
ncbi:MAG TPA: HAD family hydrolase [Nocardioides sp.]|nr:HAD family hydrolase [Nocardioides sp.]